MRSDDSDDPANGNGNRANGGSNVAKRDQNEVTGVELIQEKRDKLLNNVVQDQQTRAKTLTRKLERLLDPAHLDAVIRETKRRHARRGKKPNTYDIREELNRGWKSIQRDLNSKRASYMDDATILGRACRKVGHRFYSVDPLACPPPTL